MLSEVENYLYNINIVLLVNLKTQHSSSYCLSRPQPFPVNLCIKSYFSTHSQMLHKAYKVWKKSSSSCWVLIFKSIEQGFWIIIIHIHSNSQLNSNNEVKMERRREDDFLLFFVDKNDTLSLLAMFMNRETKDKRSERIMKEKRMKNDCD